MCVLPVKSPTRVEIADLVPKTKGDERKPQCQHCETGHRECQYDARQGSGGETASEFRFTSDHVWLDTPSESESFHHRTFNTQRILRHQYSQICTLS